MHNILRKFLKRYPLQPPPRRVQWYHDPRKLIVAIIISGGGAAAVYFGNHETIPYTNRTHFILLSPPLERQLGECQFTGLKKELAHETRRFWMTNGSPRAATVGRHMERSLRRGILMGLIGRLLLCLGMTHEVEVGHAIARHSAEKVTQNMWFAILQIVILQFIYMPDVINAMSTLLLKLPFSRKMVIETDHIGLLLLGAAGYDPRIAPSVYEKQGKIAGEH
ncbi:hypothetical protein GUJ93_ZPchr0006g45484 [Zizania palustris]|uniref:Peptidase M48 domain-containing protein n=1 Tax=Zizania palustris TaxID=103762 RepID=A0A8J5W234_ZIZPA|nr:hypothetical protein GUJ93_ZPchr0006g45484 [Zizania palustris]